MTDAERDSLLDTADEISGLLHTLNLRLERLPDGAACLTSGYSYYGSLIGQVQNLQGNITNFRHTIRSSQCPTA